LSTKYTTHVNNDAYISGSLGTAKFYQNAGTGIINKDAEKEVDSWYIGQAHGVYKSVLDQYNTQISTFTADKKKYDDSVTAQKEDPEKKLEKKPFPPKALAAYAGPTFTPSNIALTGTDTLTWANLKTKPTRGSVEAIPKNTGDTANGIKKQRFSNTFLLAYSGNTDPTTKTFEKGVGKSFGVFGQGAMSTFDSTGSMATPFIWQSVGTAARPGVQVSVFPNEAIVTDNAKPLTITYKGIPVGSQDRWAAPTAPTPPSEIADASAVTMTMSAITLGALVSTMF
jgi:hypothetical protein